MLAITLLSLTAALVAQAYPILEKRAGCKSVHLIHARGTGEPGIGSDLGMLVGQPFSLALQAKFPGNFDSAGVKYSADVVGAITGAINPTGQTGAKAMAKMAKEKMASCPETKIVLSGYSQGAEQVHGALKILGADAAKIGAAVTFGDPMNMGIIQITGNVLGGWGALPKDRAKVFCYSGDPVCGGIGISHLSYSSSAGEAASFVAKAIGSVKGGGSSSSGGSATKGKGGDSGNESKSSKGSDKNAKEGKGIFGKGSKDSDDAKGAKNAKGKDSDDAKGGKNAKGKDSGDAKGTKNGKGKDKDTTMRLEGNYDMPHFVTDSM